MSDALIDLGAGPRLGRVAWLHRRLIESAQPAVWTADRLGGRAEREARRLIESAFNEGAAVVLGPGEAGAAACADLVLSPRAFGLIAADPSRLAEGDQARPPAPDWGAPDMIADDHAAWLIGAWAAARTKVVVIEAGEIIESRITPRGAAWLASLAMSALDEPARASVLEAACASA